MRGFVQIDAVHKCTVCQSRVGVNTSLQRYILALNFIGRPLLPDLEVNKEDHLGGQRDEWCIQVIDTSVLLTIVTGAKIGERVIHILGGAVCMPNNKQSSC